uniref:glutathione gamma-glutamylcysteinyltransferase n=1 Tax=Cyanothece sp. (strain PCC 7425 / ATCC 29141) TaxID=395961 RepID=B8HTL1_CYAP4
MATTIVAKFNRYLPGILLGLVLGGAGGLAQTLPLAENLINLASPQGEELLFSSPARRDFLPLSTQFVTQINQAYCGVASSVMVLNALGIKAPLAPEYAPYHVFTQDNFFTAATQGVTTIERVRQRGMTLAQLGQLLASHGATPQVYHAADSSLEDFRRKTIANLNQPHNFVLVNYLRRTLKQEWGGHISPIAAYHQQSDRFLILDVSRYKYPPVWVKAEDLWQAMNTLDPDSGLTRGFVLVNRP